MRDTRDDVLGTGPTGLGLVWTCPRRTRRATIRTAVFVAASVAVTVGLGLPALAVIGIAVAGLAAAAVVEHRVAGSLFAGLTLLLARPYNPGEHVRLYAPALRTVVVAEIVRTGLVHTTLATSSGLLVVPNSLLLRAIPPEPERGVSD